MHLEVVQLLANAAADSTIGVNVVLDQVPRTAQRRPPNVQVYDESRAGWVSRLELPEDPPEGVALPGLIVLLGAPILWSGKASPTRDAAAQKSTPVTAQFHYLTKETDTAVAVADAMLTFRALRSVLTMLAQPDCVARRVLQDVRLETLVDMQYDRLFTPLEDVLLAGRLLTTWTARETLLHYTP